MLRGNFDVRLGGAARWALLHGPPELKIHVAVGLAIGACAIALLGLFTSVPAGLAGAAFLAYHRDDLYSLLMSIGALFSYGTGLYLKR